MPVVEMRSLEEIESCYDVELSNEILAQYWSDQPGNGLGVLSVVSRWNAGIEVPHGDIQVHEAVLDMDKHIAWLHEHPAPDVNLDEALAVRAVFAAHWNEQFRKEGTKREDELGPVEAALA